MKMMRVSSLYPVYRDLFYQSRPELALKSYQEQYHELMFDSFSWANFWTNPLSKFGIEMQEVLYGVGPLEKAWWKENRSSQNSPPESESIVLEQIKTYKPDIIWFDDHNQEFLKRIKRDVLGIKLTLGWMGSAVPKVNVINEVDLMLSCAPETVERIRSSGKKCEHLNHGFSIEILNRVSQEKEKRRELIFIGQLVNHPDFHRSRQELLEYLSNEKNLHLKIFSDNNSDFKSDAKRKIKNIAISAAKLLKDKNISSKLINHFAQQEAIGNPLPKIILQAIRPSMYGLRMYETIKSSLVTLNIHANSSPEYASNMRLFEVTGVGSCLLTDWKKNISEFFEVNKEVVAYKTKEECLEKSKWLLENPKEAEAIGLAAQTRVLREHTIEKRAEALYNFIRLSI